MNDDIRGMNVADMLKNMNEEFSYSKICELRNEQSKKYKQMLEELKIINEDKDSKKKERGEKLEEIVTYLLQISGNLFEVIQNVRTETNEVDQVIKLTQAGKYLKENGIINNKYETFLGECKNYGKKVSVTYVGKFCSLLLTTGTKLGILFSYNGVTGNGWKDSKGLIKKIYMSKEKESEKICIIDFSYDDFYSILEGNNFLQIVEDKLTELKIDTSYKNLISKHPAQDIIF